MPILLDVRETFGENRRGATQTETNTSYQRVFYVTFDSYVTNLQDVLDATGIPSIGDYYIDSGTFATARSKNVQELNGSRSQFAVIVNYDSQRDDGSGSFNINPLNDPWKINISSRDRSIVPSELFEWDVDSNSWVQRPVRNRAYDEFDPQPTIQYNDLTITLDKNYSSIKWNFIDLQNKVNSDSIQIWGKTFGIRTLFIDSITCSGYEERNGFGFYKHTFKLHYRLPILSTIKDYPGGGWDLLLANMGYNELSGDSAGTKKRILIAGAPSTVPQPLDKDGKFDENSELFLQYKLPECAFSTFNFPTSADEN